MPTAKSVRSKAKLRQLQGLLSVPVLFFPVPRAFIRWLTRAKHNIIASCAVDSETSAGMELKQHQGWLTDAISENRRRIQLRLTLHLHGFNLSIFYASFYSKLSRQLSSVFLCVSPLSCSAMSAPCRFGALSLLWLVHTVFLFLFFVCMCFLFLHLLCSALLLGLQHMWSINLCICLAEHCFVLLCIVFLYFQWEHSSSQQLKYFETEEQHFGILNSNDPKFNLFQPPKRFSDKVQN